jgi:hypothetical protein
VYHGLASENLLTSLQTRHCTALYSKYDVGRLTRALYMDPFGATAIDKDSNDEVPDRLRGPSASPRSGSN